MTNTALADLRKEYTQQSLDRADVLPNPFAQFERWFIAAQEAEVHEPNAMNLATVSADGHPSARIVLLKGVDDECFLFYTNYESRKGQHLHHNPHVALTFFWPELERQVRIEGQVAKLDEDTSSAYFQSRPRGSQLGAWVSPQSQVITDRSVLEQRQQELDEHFNEDKIPRPHYWGGYAVQPRTIEFWQGRPSRLHDRLQYRRQDDDRWVIERLAP